MAARPLSRFHSSHDPFALSAGSLGSPLPCRCSRSGSWCHSCETGGYGRGSRGVDTPGWRAIRLRDQRRGVSTGFHPHLEWMAIRRLLRWHAERVPGPPPFAGRPMAGDSFCRLQIRIQRRPQCRLPRHLREGRHYSPSIRSSRESSSLQNFHAGSRAASRRPCLGRLSFRSHSLVSGDRQGHRGDLSEILEYARRRPSVPLSARHFRKRR